MQLEAKLQIRDAATFDAIHGALCRVLGNPLRVLSQRCVFLDGSAGELARVNAVCRVRSEAELLPSENGQLTMASPSKQSPSTAVIKEHNEVQDGSTARFVMESKMPPGAAFLDSKTIVALLSKTPLGETILNRFGDISLTTIGGFDNIRTVFGGWQSEPGANALRVHLDRTQYPFGEGYEIEVPCDTGHCIEDVIRELYELLKSTGTVADIAAAVQPGTRSKFQTYADGMKRYRSGDVSIMMMQAKMTLPNTAAYERVLARLIQHHIVTDEQHNYFFDGAEGQLSREGAYLRLREAGGVFTVTIKQHTEVDAGSSLSWQQDAIISSDAASSIMHLADAMPLIQTHSSDVGEALCHRFGVADGRLRFVGGFTNRRSVFSWPEGTAVQEGLELRVDETTFNNGSAAGTVRHEIEVAKVSVPIVDVLDVLRSTLLSLGIAECRPSTESKFAQMLAALS